MTRCAPLSPSNSSSSLRPAERPHAKIEFTGKGPYFKPGTTELVIPVAGGR